MIENVVSCANCGNLIKINETKKCTCGWEYQGGKKFEYAEIDEKPKPNIKSKKGKKKR